MDIQKAKEIQKIMNSVEFNAKLLLNNQVKAGARILKSVTDEEERQGNLGGALWALVTTGGELRALIEELMDAVESDLS